MSSELELINRVREMRRARGWSQDELARRSGLSRTGVSAIETRRLVPSTAAALALARAMDCRVEEMFSLPGGTLADERETWAWPAPTPGIPWRYWRAEVGGRHWLYPVEPTPLGFSPHDGIAEASDREGPKVDEGDQPPSSPPSRTLVMASCDPAVGLLRDELARDSGIRLLVFQRSSRQAIELLRRGLVHAAGVHLARAESSETNDEAVAELLEPGSRFQLLRVADWDEGIALAPSAGVSTVGQAVRGSLRWIGREEGSGARQCLDEVLQAHGRKNPPSMLPPAGNHRGVAEAIRIGWADAGICLRLASEEAGLDFLAVRREAYDVCFAAEQADDPRLRALIRVVRSSPFRQILGELPGYSSERTGEMRSLDVKPSRSEIS